MKNDRSAQRIRDRARATTGRALQRQVRQIYEDCPYPGTDHRRGWLLAPMDWIQTLWRPERESPEPKRILIAGCGTGAEAFSVRRRFPTAEIVAFDFCRRSIAIAQESERRRRHRRPIRFLLADLASDRLPRVVGRGFDFVSCHGVLSYVPAAAGALGNLARCMARDGALYLGVNGSSHRSTALRGALPMLGFDIGRLEDGPALRDALKLCDAVMAGRERTARETAPYLASDVFGPLFRNLALSEWIRLARTAGLYFHGSLSVQRNLRPAIARGLTGLLIPRSRAEVCELLETLWPAAFHPLVFTRQPPSDPPWARRDKLLGWRPVVTKLYRGTLPPPAASRATVTFTSAALNARVSCNLCGWEAELLRGADGAHSIEWILKRARVNPPLEDLVQHVYVLHQLLVINLLRPRGRM